MFEESQICPYTGLRSFTEEESLYFKGRDEHIVQATEQLQRQKFLMLTGASGDGKSSLVYAGIIPNARAGFLKSKFTQWCVADFRPERTPFKNLAHALARQLEIANPSTVESELQHGFSALVDLYRNSSRYLDSDSIEWRDANEQGRNALKRKASNLIILVDQFEEFFTNPENYHQGVPSRDSNLVLNLLLETARIAMDEDLPIYVIFTMRSDYIGQCAAFRTLPEYIGFSQFFVPRLNRTQLQQVIEEPAILSGNRITRRLTERLIHDIAEGVDQLPILQHALNQIWHAASSGKEEMDLLHYAMVGGMPSNDLPDEQSQAFAKWYSQQPEKVKSFYREPKLSNVLDAHANKLFELAAESYATKTGKSMDVALAKEIIKATFICLTKIDQSRAVRNRMTLLEITNILQHPMVDTATVGRVLEIFREPGNTFIRPFILEESQSNNLSNDDVLDITHESLIRNWELLGSWAREEFSNYSISQDFEQQLDRWVQSGKSSTFLLSMGPLTYFESWYAKVRPNAWWIARYLPEDETQQQKIEKASVILSNGKEFLRRSARKHAVTRTVIRYGPGRIAAIIGLIGLLVLTSFGVLNYVERQNNFVLKKIKHESIQMAGNRKVFVEDKCILLAENLKLGLTTIPEIMSGINDPIDRVSTIAALGTSLIVQGWQTPQKEIYQSLGAVDSLLEAFPITPATPHYNEVLREANKHMVTLEFAYHFNPTEKMQGLVQRCASVIARWVLMIAREKPSAFNDIKNFNLGLENAINHKALSGHDIAMLLSALSPLEESAADPWVNKNFTKEQMMDRGAFNYAFAYNGLFQELGYLYGTQGNAPKALQCLDTLLKYNQKYFQNDYANMADNGFHIAATFHVYGQDQAMSEFVAGYCTRKKVTAADFYYELTSLSRISRYSMTRLNTDAGSNKPENGLLTFSDHDRLTYWFNQYRLAIRNSTADADSKNFYTALSYKEEGMDKHMLAEHSQQSLDMPEVNMLFDSAISLYRKVSKPFLNKKVGFNNNSESWPIKYLFLYPDINKADHPTEKRFNIEIYASGSFAIYLLNQNLIDELYPSEEELKYIEQWLSFYVTAQGFLRSAIVCTPVDPQVLRALYSKLSEPGKPKTLNLSSTHLLLGHSQFDKNHKDSALYYYDQVNVLKVLEIISDSPSPTPAMTLLGQATTDLCQLGEPGRAFKIIQAFKKPVNRSSLYAYTAQSLMLKRIDTPLINQLIDSAKREMFRVERSGADQQSRYQVPYALALRNQGDDLETAVGMIKNVTFKIFIQQALAKALAFQGDLYQAYSLIPPNTSSPDKAAFLWFILKDYNDGLNKPNPAWTDYTKSYLIFLRRTIFYDDETN